MREATARRLVELTSAFYREVGESFSQTRTMPWAGWECVLQEYQQTRGNQASAPLRVVDLACGNMRFERYIASLQDSTSLDQDLVLAPQIRAYAVDMHDAMSCGVDTGSVDVTYAHLDIAEALFAKTLSDALKLAVQQPVDLAVCFGYLHHVPLYSQRVQLLEALITNVAPGGVVAVSLWQFAQSGRLLAKAQAMREARAAELGLYDLSPEDYLLGWQDRSDVVRYCHNFNNDEVERLIEDVSARAQLRACFSADGVPPLNRYLIWQV